MKDFKFNIKCERINDDFSIEKDLMYSDVSGMDDIRQVEKELFSGLKEIDPRLKKKQCKFIISCV